VVLMPFELMASALGASSIRATLQSLFAFAVLLIVYCIAHVTR
jgi:hypothetical protein